MKISRREATATAGSLILASAGCLQRLPTDRDESDPTDTTGESGETTEEFSVEDLSVRNERDEAVEVTVSVSRNSESVLEETFTLDPGEAKTYEDVMANEREYEVTVSADGLTKTVTFDEHRDNAGVQFSITREKIESVEIVH